MSILKLHHTYENRGYENIPAVAPLKQSKKEGEPSSLAAAADETAARKTDSVEISPEGRLAAVQEKEIQEPAAQETEAQEAAAKDSDSPSGKVAVNEGKRARQIAAAQNLGRTPASAGSVGKGSFRLQGRSAEGLVRPVRDRQSGGADQQGQIPHEPGAQKI